MLPAEIGRVARTSRDRNMDAAYLPTINLMCCRNDAIENALSIWRTAETLNSLPAPPGGTRHFQQSALAASCSRRPDTYSSSLAGCNVR
jgi:hypothetical protein